MKYCNNCKRLTPGDPLFCNHCGRSYDIRLCGAKHVNPRSAEICSQCGSREMSVPQPKIPLGKRTLLLALRFLPSVVVMITTVGFFFFLLYAAFVNQQLERAVMSLGILLVVLWLAYLQLPSPVRGVVRRAVGGPRKGGHH